MHLLRLMRLHTATVEDDQTHAMSSLKPVRTMRES